jgi:5-methylcytosine-specific restriction endonuclease McrA
MSAVDRERQRRWREANPEKYAEQRRRYYARHAERIRLEQLARYHADPGPYRASWHRWRDQNPWTYRRARVVERARGAAGADYLTPERLKARHELYGFRCAYCGAATGATDHVRPVTREGLHLPTNLVPACRRCNVSKRDRTLDEWAAWLDPSDPRLASGLLARWARRRLRH